MLTMTQKTRKKREPAKVWKMEYDLPGCQPKVSSEVNNSTSTILPHDVNGSDLIVLRLVDFQECRLRPQKWRHCSCFGPPPNIALHSQQGLYHLRQHDNVSSKKDDDKMDKANTAQLTNNHLRDQNDGANNLKFLNLQNFFQLTRRHYLFVSIWTC